MRTRNHHFIYGTLHDSLKKFVLHILQIKKAAPAASICFPIIRLNSYRKSGKYRLSLLNLQENRVRNLRPFSPPGRRSFRVTDPVSN